MACYKYYQHLYIYHQIDIIFHILLYLIYLLKLVLYYKGIAEPNNKEFDKYADWVKENLGLETLVLKSDETLDYDIYWKNKLVKVIK